MGRIWLNMQDLETTNVGLKAAIRDFTEVADGNDSAEDAVGKPANKGELHAKVHDFEADWNNNREKLTEGLTKLQEHLQGIIDGFNDYDTELAEKLTPEQKQQLSQAGPNNGPMRGRPA